jgi:hypothetical protein
MVVKKESVCKKTGEKKTHFTTDKEGYKIVMQQGNPVETKMTTQERSNRDHGSSTVGHGSEGSSNRQKGITRTNKEAETEYKEKLKKVSESNDIQKKQKKVEDLSMKLKKAKLDYGTAMLDKKVAEFDKMERVYKKASDFMKGDIKKVKDNNLFFVRGTKANNPEKLEKDIVGKIQQVVGEPQVKEEETDKEEVTEAKSVDARLDKVKELDKLMYNGKDKSYVKGDVLSKLNKKLEEAEDEEEEDADDIGAEEEPEEGDEDLGDELGDDLGDEEGEEEEDAEAEEEPNEDEIPAQDNEIQRVTKANEFNVDENNVYEYYDYILDRLIDPTAVEAMNAEYDSIPKEKRKIMPARELYDRVTKRLNMMNKTEADSLNAELSGAGGEEEEGGEDDLGI